MLFYLLLPLLCLVMLIFTSSFKNKEKVFFIIVLLILYFLSSFRSEQIGADYSVYTNIFKNVNTYFNTYPIERGYMILNYIVSIFSKSYVALSLVINSVIFVGFYFFIKNNVEKKYYFWIVLIFILNPYLYIQSTFNVVRQTMAIFIFLFGMLNLNSEKSSLKKYILYLLCCILGAQFHSSCYIYMLLILFIKGVRWNRKKFIALLIISLICNFSLSNSTILYYISDFFGYKTYFGYAATRFNFPLFIIFVVGIALILIMNYDKIKVEKKEKVFLDTYIISLILLPTFAINDIMYRLYVGMVFISLPAIPVILRYCKSLSKRTVTFVGSSYALYYGLMYLLFVMSILNSNNVRYIPFKFFWQ